MKEIGIVRRIDGLGRVVIPKELRKTMKIREGDLFEMYVNQDGNIVLGKYSMMSAIEDQAIHYIESLSLTIKHTICITNREKIIAVSSNNRKMLLDKRISDKFQNTMLAREIINTRNPDIRPIQILKDMSCNFTQQIIIPIICEGDVIGSLMIMQELEKLKITEAEEHTAIAVASIIGKQLESQMAS